MPYTYAAVYQQQPINLMMPDVRDTTAHLMPVRDPLRPQRPWRPQKPQVPQSTKASKTSKNPTGNVDMTRIRNFFAALSRRFRGFRGDFAAVSRGFAHSPVVCLRKDSQPFRKASQLRIRVISSLPVGFQRPQSPTESPHQTTPGIPPPSRASRDHWVQYNHPDSPDRTLNAPPRGSTESYVWSCL